MLDQEVKVLYPEKSCIFDISRASDKLMKVQCRDDPSIFGSRQVEDSSTLRASESFGSFGVEVADFLQRKQEEVEREKSLGQDRKRKMEWELEKRRLFDVRVFPIFVFFAAVILGYLVVTACQDPEAEGHAAFLCFSLVLGLFALCRLGFLAQAILADSQVHNGRS